MSNQNTKTYSWTAIIIVLFIFWPVGLFMLFSKLSNDRTATFGGGAAMIKFIGVVLVILGVTMLATLSSGDASVATTGVIMAAIFAIPGFYLINKSRDIRKSGNRNRQYIELVINNKVHEVHELARRLRVSQEVVIKDVNDMINRGMLGAARLNLNSGIIQFPRPKQKQEQRYGERTDSHYNQRPTQQKRPEHVYESFQPKTIRCTSCSANNFVESLPATCEYCGNSLHEKK
jgi:hypothetical protein